MRTSRRLGVVGFAGFASLVGAQDPATVPVGWTARGIGGGGAFFAPAISPHVATTCYVATDMIHLQRSSDFGDGWRMFDFRAVQAGSRSTVHFSADPQALWVIDVRDDLSRLRRSVDGGASWGMVSEPSGGNLLWLGVDATSTQRLLCASDTTLYSSTQGGAQFAAVHAEPGGLHIAGVHFAGAEVFVGTNRGLLQSSDGGVTFTPAAIPGLPADHGFLGFAGAGSGANVRLCGTIALAAGLYPGLTGADHPLFAGVVEWHRGQAGWQSRAGGLSAGDHPVFVASSPSTPLVFWLAGHRFTGSEDVPAVWRSVDGATTWSLVLRAAGNANVATGWMGQNGDRGWSYGEYALGLAVAPTDPQRAIVTDLGGVHVTADGGQNWRAVHVAPPSRNAAGMPTPRGRDYVGVLDNTSAWWLHWPTDEVVWACATDIRGCRSRDAGLSWAFDYSGHTENTMYHVVEGGGVLYGATSTVHDLYESTYLQDARIDPGGGRVLQSTDQGRSWTLVHDFGDPVVRLALDPNAPRRLYASVANHGNGTGGIWVTDDVDRGVSSTWRRLAGPPRTEGHPFTIAVLNDGTLVCTCSARRTAAGAFTASSGVFVSSDGGASWQDRSHPDMQWWTRELTLDPHDASQRTFLVGVWSGWGGVANNRGGLFRTTDRGLTWRRLNAWHRVSAADIEPLRPGHAYVTTEAEGLWYTADVGAANPTFVQLRGFPFRHPGRVLFPPQEPTRPWVTTVGASVFAGVREWTDLGLGKAGSVGVPALCGGGALAAGSEVVWHLHRGVGMQPGLLCLGLQRQDLPLLGGTLVPGPELAISSLALDARGVATARLRLPQLVPAGVRVFAQAWLLDAAAVQGVAASNAVSAVAR